MLIYLQPFFFVHYLKKFTFLLFLLSCGHVGCVILQKKMLDQLNKPTEKQLNKSIKEKNVSCVGLLENSKETGLKNIIMLS